MKKTIYYLLFISFYAASCGSKTKVEHSMFATSNSVSAEKNIISEKEEVSERTCIDQALVKELDAGESIKKLVANTDLDFCNGVRVRLKTYQFTSKKYKAFGFVRSNSGHETCIKESDNFSHTIFLGDKGVLIGENIKILLGGHQFNSDNQIVASENRLARYVKFDWGDYSGELAIVEKGKLRCWAIH